MIAEDIQIKDSVSSAAHVREACLEVAGIRMAFISDEHEIQMRVEGAARKFLAGDAAPDVTVRVAWGDLRDEIGGEKIFDSGALWQLYRHDDSYLFRFATPHFGPTPYKVASFNREFTHGELYLHRAYFIDRPVYPLEYPLDELLMLNLLAQGRGVELHSCGIACESGAGFLFVGQSGAGKTTTARIWERQRGVEILSDDRIIVRREGQAFCMYGTPWHGEAELASASRAPLTRIFFLRHGRRNELVRLAAVEASARLFSCSFPTFYNTDGLAFTLAFFDELTSALPCYELSFVPDQSALDFVRQQSS